MIKDEKPFGDIESQGSLNNNISKPTILALTQVFKALSDPTRINIIYFLSISDELSVGDIAVKIGLTSSAASYQLRFLENLGLVRARIEKTLNFTPYTIMKLKRESN